MKFNYKLLGSLVVAGSLALGSCKKTYFDTTPTDQLSSNDIFKTTTGAYTALEGIHNLMISTAFFNGNHANWGQKAWDLGNDFMGNDMVGSNSGYNWFIFHYNHQHFEIPNSWGTTFLWMFYYRIINNANAIIQNIDQAEGPIEQKKEVKAQALAYRAFAYFNLVQYYQFTYVGNEDKPGIPIYTKTTTPDTEPAPRGTLRQNYDLIYSDIKQAVTLLEEAGGSLRGEISHISLPVAQGLYARIALVMNKWTEARDMAINALSAGSLMSPIEYTAGQNKATNPEWLWGSTYSAEQYESLGILCYISWMDPNSGGYASASADIAPKITKELYSVIPEGDIRRSVFNTSTRTQTKFRTNTPGSFNVDYCYMRVAEMYLIAAEAEYHISGDAVTVKEYLGPLMDARGNTEYVSMSGSTLYEFILLQRRIELWGEGFAYFDLQRLKRPVARTKTPAGSHMAHARVFDLPATNGFRLMRIPQRELDNNPNITPADQNPEG